MTENIPKNRWSKTSQARPNMFDIRALLTVECAVAGMFSDKIRNTDKERSDWCVTSRLVGPGQMREYLLGLFAYYDLCTHRSVKRTYG